MIVLFLDVDGVLNTYSPMYINTQGDNESIHIDVDKVKILSKIVRTTDIMLIMHSGWRFSFNDSMEPISQEAEKLNNLFLSYGIKLSGKTPDFSTDEIKRNKKFSLVKASEIKEWLKLHPECKKYLIIEDLDLHDEELIKHQIRPDPTLGLTEHDAQKAIKYLSE